MSIILKIWPLAVLPALIYTAPAPAQTLNINPSSLVFCGEPGQGLSSVPIKASSTAGPFSFTVSSVTSDQNWLILTPMSGVIDTTARTVFYASVNGSVVTLPPGTYSGRIAIANTTGTAIGAIDATLVVSRTACNGSGTGLISATPGALAFQLPAGAGSASQEVDLTNFFPTEVSVLLDPAAGGVQSWIAVLDNTNLLLATGTTTPTSVAVSAAGLTPGTYRATVEYLGTNGMTLDLPVTLTVGAQPTSYVPAASPNPVSLSLPFGTPLVRQGIQFTNSSALPINVTVDPSYLSGHGWLSLSPSAALIPAGASLTLTVTLNTANLAPGANSATINVAVTSGGGGSFHIPVTVNYGASAGNSSLSVTPAQLSFAYQTGTTAQLTQSLALASSSAASFSVQTSTSDRGNWLSATPASGVTSAGGPTASVVVQVNPSGLPARAFNGQVLVTNTTTGAQELIPVTLVVSDQPVLSVGTGSTVLNYQAGTAIPPPVQTLSVTSSGSQLAFNTSLTPVSGGNFLIAGPASGATPQMLTLAVDPAAALQLAPNAYVENVVVSSPGAGNTAVFPVILNVTNSPLLNPSQSSITFNAQIGQMPPPAQYIRVGTTSAALKYSVAASAANCNGFLSAAGSGGDTPGVIAVFVNPAGLQPGTCIGAVTLTSSSAGNSPFSIPVTLNVASAPRLSVNPTAINLTTQTGSNPPAQTIVVAATDASTPLNFTVTTTTDASKGWLAATPAAGTSGSAVTVTLKTSALAAGTYTGRIDIAVLGQAGSPITIPVMVTVTAAATASASPAALVFAQAFEGLQAGPQGLQLTSTIPGILFTSSAATFNGGNWLSVANSGNTTPASVTVTANTASLTQGTYSGLVTLSIPGMANTPIYVPVSVTIGPPRMLSVSPSTLSFHFQQGSPPPPAPALQVTSTGGSAAFTVATAAQNGAVNFLNAVPANSVTPGAVLVGLNPAVLSALPPGKYAGTVTVSSPDIPASTQMVTVSLTVDAAPPAVSAAVNAASLQTGGVAPGEMITIYGANLGPPDGLLFSLTPQGTLPMALGGAAVTFDGNPAPLIFVRADQINALVPYEVAGNTSTNLVVTRNGLSSPPLALALVETNPAIFSMDQSGSGAGAIRNADGSVNAPDNPAAAGSVVQIYATGEGLAPGAATGSVTPVQPPFPLPAASVSLTIGGQPAQIQYAGEAPGAAAGLLQINAVIPNSLAPGAQPVVLAIGKNNNAAQMITIAIK